MSTLMTADEAWAITKENKEKFEAVALADVLKSLPNVEKTMCVMLLELPPKQLLNLLLIG